MMRLDQGLANPTASEVVSFFDKNRHAEVAGLEKVSVALRSAVIGLAGL